MQRHQEEPSIDPSLPVLFYRTGEDRFANSEQLIAFIKSSSPAIRQMIQPWNVAEFKRPPHITHVPTLQIGSKAHVGDHAMAWVEGLSTFEELSQRVSECTGGVCKVPGGHEMEQQQQQQPQMPLMHGAAPLEDGDGPIGVTFEIGKKMGPPSQGGGGTRKAKEVEPLRGGTLSSEEKAQQKRLEESLKRLKNAPMQ